jgi:hypothetical protein
MAARLPTIYGFREHVNDGGLISYGIKLSENLRHCAWKCCNTEVSPLGTEIASTLAVLTSTTDVPASGRRT